MLGLGCRGIDGSENPNMNAPCRPAPSPCPVIRASYPTLPGFTRQHPRAFVPYIDHGSWEPVEKWKIARTRDFRCVRLDQCWHLRDQRPVGVEEWENGQKRDRKLFVG